LRRAIALLGREEFSAAAAATLPDALPEDGAGDVAALQRLAPHVLGRAARLGAPASFAQMDPPTPWLTWALTLWNASLNQNLLHPRTAPFARDAEERVVAWLAPFFGMAGGHMTPGSSLANLTALWAARDAAGVKRVVASEAAHLSVEKAARILGLAFETVPTDAAQRLDAGALKSLSDACLVLTAGTTTAGAIDPLTLDHGAAWTHVDAAWAGPLCLSPRYQDRFAGIARADSVVVSAHKLLFQPKESSLVMFREPERANAAISFRGGYLTVPNIGVLSSHGAMAVPLLGTLLAWGRHGLVERIERCMAAAERLAAAIAASPQFELFAPPQTGLVVFRPKDGAVDALAERLAPLTASTAPIKGEVWLRCVAANPNVDIDGVIEKIGLAAPI
jgi:glutamate/tyrosine decarboxylase-like PLP-dependent enzyme